MYAADGEPKVDSARQDAIDMLEFTINAYAKLP